MRHEDTKQAMLRVLVDRILHGEGATSPDQRQRAFDNNDVAPPLHTVVDKVTTRPAAITDADFAAARESGFSEDQLFELVIAAAVGQSARLYSAGLTALAEAGTVTAEDMRQVLAVGVSHQQVRDALAVCASFNTTNRLADAFGFEQLSPAGFGAGAAYLIRRGYR